ncbi:centromere protein H (CENP-H)-domain-containing protein [Myxozyma melibiosi]|uniref:Centromere protein H (CENP-H)-domain-containing protein n=1 Tax=Myxozyma melibiosi TaxID=54550 RepID=A0ABR1F5K6_9ASCO
MAVVSKLASELSKLKAQIHSVRKDIKQLHKENRQTTSQLISLIQEHKHRRADILSDDTQRLIKSYREAVSVTEQKIETLKPVLLGLIMGSGLNWSTDESLREIVLECSSSRSGNSDSSDDDDGSFDYDPGE